ncbi:MAG: NUDIX hydrolase [Deltaproteobacteria bacterium]|nr:NUDIX hydrolase [Deltaproteobacteria bacterium]
MEKKITTLAGIQTRSFSASLDEVILRDGKTGKRIKIDHPEAAAVIPFVSDEEILMVRQHRYALGKETLEIPAGKLDPGETPEACVRRELLEETGYEAGELTFLYTYAPAIGYSNELIHIYSARSLKKRRKKIDEREISSVEIHNLRQLRKMMKKGLLVDGKTLLALFLTGIKVF